VQVLNAYDIYPSHNASANSIPEKEALLALITQVSAALNMSLLELLEDRPGTILSPTSEVRGGMTRTTTNTHFSRQMQWGCAVIPSLRHLQ
jgi:hypothetical protein